MGKKSVEAMGQRDPVGEDPAGAVPTLSEAPSRTAPKDSGSGGGLEYCELLHVFRNKRQLGKKGGTGGHGLSDAIPWNRATLEASTDRRCSGRDVPGTLTLSRHLSLL